MNFKSGINLSESFQAIHTCQGEVIFETPEGDRLNLKSALSQFAFPPPRREGFVSLMEICPMIWLTNLSWSRFCCEED